ncbi:MAG TPA: methanogenesis marker 3 protein [Methanocorpusculum sp.]|nr:methanogenesis marker 3 protein [Methanocorpusculum sp.]HJJ50139.1 methanogenesis marker 3 protein [Methanocorpusculum sp.]HKL97718.1 methanogenesis marker 3 protein [Methanocorpusculum sp.]
MTNIKIFLNGEQKTVAETTTIRDLLPKQPEGTSVVLLLPGSVSREKTPHLRLTTSAGDIVLELAKEMTFPLLTGDVEQNLRVHFEDRNAVSFGPFPQEFTPDKNSYRYERGTVCLGSGGYDSNNAYLTFSRREHMADHGAAKGGAILGKVIYGLGIMNRWKNGDTITHIEEVFSSTDSANAKVTDDLSTEVKDGMQIFSELVITAEGYQDNHAEIDCVCAESVEHMLFCLRENRFQIDRTASTYIRDHTEGKLFAPQELQKPRREGTVTVRTAGKGTGGLYIYTTDVPSNQHHTRTGSVTRGIELAKFSTEKTILSVNVLPKLLDLRGLPLGDAVDLAKKRGLKVMADNRDVTGRVVINQKPETTLEVLKEGKVSLSTMSLENVIDISLDYEKAPLSVDLFRRVTGLKRYAVGTMPFIYNLEDQMYLFKPPFSSGTNIIPENTPKTPVKTNALALTNDSRQAVGMVGVRVVENKEYGPTGEPFGGTNIIGTVIDMDKLSVMKEGGIVYIREIKQ